MRHGGSTAPHGIGNQGPLDDTVLIRHVGTRRIRRDDAGAGDGTQVKVHAARLCEHFATGIVSVADLRPGRRQRRRMCSRRVRHGLRCLHGRHGFCQRRRKQRAVLDLRNLDARLAQLLQALRGLLYEAAHGFSLRNET